METILTHGEDLVSFVSVAEEGGFSAAAMKLGLTKSTVSKRISRLEGRLGVRLFRRTTRALHLTDVGSRLLGRAQAIAEAAREAEAEVHDTQAGVRGRLRVNAPVSFGLRHVTPVVSDLAKKHPELEVELDLSDRRIDLISEGYDSVIRVGDLDDSSLIAKKLTQVRFRVVASNEYLEQHGQPRSPDQLTKHHCLLFRYQASGNHWLFKTGDRTMRIPVRGPLLSNHGEVLLDAALQGLGIAMLPSFIVDDAVRAGDLQVLFSRSCRLEVGVYALLPPGRRTPNKVSMFVDALESSLREPK
ncbi:MAG: LysR family transcriptional regulator [Myxococcales bacterium]|nr:LysR family transcriptional regulator [Myxococcales bacterium]